MADDYNEEIRERLQELADEKYRQFHGSLLPGTEQILGVRIPILRKLAREILKEDWRAWLQGADERTYEETMLQGFVIAYARLELLKKLALVKEFVPKIDNWAVCDCFCNTLKEAGKYPEQVWEFLLPYAGSRKEYEARFAAVMLLCHYVKEEYLYRSLALLETIRQEGYYAKMAVAWALSVYFAAFPERMLTYLQERGALYEEFTYKKTLQKIIESNRVDKEMKRMIQEMR